MFRNTMNANHSMLGLILIFALFTSLFTFAGCRVVDSYSEDNSVTQLLTLSGQVVVVKGSESMRLAADSSAIRPADLSGKVSVASAEV